MQTPASIMKIKDGRITLRSIGEMNYQRMDVSQKYYVDAFRCPEKNGEKEDSDNRRYGILLSGGLDSRAILAASDSPMTTFTIADFENREVEVAKRISNEKGCKNVFIKRDPNHYANIIDCAVELGDGMYRYDHAHF
jgi:asparagine synthase (glutamine-hydrolysing)